jgi:hypothetical protein
MPSANKDGSDLAKERFPKRVQQTFIQAQPDPYWLAKQGS